MGKLNFCKTCGSMQLEEAKDKIEKLLKKTKFIPTRCGLCNATISERRTGGSGKEKNVFKVKLKVKPETDKKSKRTAMKKRKRSSLVKSDDDSGTLDMTVDDDDDIEMIEVPIRDVTDDVNDGINTPELSSDGDNNDYDDEFEPDDGVEEEMNEKQDKDKPLIHTVNKTLLAPDVLEILGNANEQADLVVPQCKFCEESFYTVHKLLAHVADKHKEVNKITEPYQCPTCQLRFLRAKAMKRHLETKHKPVHTCKICNKSSKLANFLEKHAKTHERRDTLFQCTELYCLVQCKTKKDFQRHQMIHTGYKPYVCETCGKGYIRPSDLKAHKRTHTGDYIHCTLCDTFRTNRNTTLRKHMREHHGNKPVERKPIVRNHMCELCGLALATNAALKKHRMSVHTREKLYHCNQCDYTTTHKNNVQSHIKMVHEKLKPYKCQFCEKFFALPKTRNEHQRIHTGEKPYTCEFCGKAFSRADGLRSHRKLHVADFKFECDVCGYKTIRSKSLKQHKEKNHSGETLTFNCTKCNMSFCTAQTLNAHNKEHKDGVEYVAKKEHQCTECDFSADNQRALQQHVKHCHSANPEAPQFECGYCHKRFNSKASCENHVEKSHERYFRPIVSQGDTETITNTSNPTVTAIPNTTSDITAEAISSIQVVPTSASATERKPIVKNHMCELCGVACSTNAALKNHRVSVHTKAKLYSCDQCDYVTSHRGNVPTHINAVHKKLKPHKCQFCEKSFALIKTRNDHQRIHTGEKPYVCDFCGKGFGRADGLKSHRKLHVADFKFECDVCGYKTVRSQSLKQHKEKHHSGETMTFNCTKCNMSFSTAQTLNAHNKEHKDGVEYVAKKEHQCTECDFSADNQRALQKHVKNCHTADPEAPQFECGYCHKKFNSKLLCENHVEKSHERYFRPAISQGDRETITTSSNPTVTAIPIKIYASTTSDITAEAVSSIIVPQVLPHKSAGQVVPTSAPATVIPAGEEEVAAAAAVLGMLPGGYPPGSGQVAIVSSEVTVPFSK